MPQPGKISKHGTLNERDVEGVRAVDVDQVIQHRNSANTSHLFGRYGDLPPEDAVAVERRYTRYWSLEGEQGLNYVGLNKANSNSKGRFEIKGLPEGEYKLAVRLIKGPVVYDYATMPLGVILGGVSSLVAPADKREETFARGMPTEYVEVNMAVRNNIHTIMEQRVEIDQGIDSFTRVFTVKEEDAMAHTNLTLVCNSYSLVKKMRVQADLFRCDPAEEATERWTRSQKAKKAAHGRRLVNQALSGNGPAGLVVNQPLAAPTRPADAPPRQPKAKRTVFIRDDVPVSSVLVKFYRQYAPEKVPEVPKIIEHFLTRDKHLGVLFATLENKYRVRFTENGEWHGLHE